MEKRDSAVKMYLRQLRSDGVYPLASIMALAPLERYTLLSQTRSLSRTPEIYKSFINYIISVPSREGPRGYWRGTMSSITHFLMVSVLNFRSFYYIRKKIIQDSNPEASELAFKQGLSNITTFAFCELFAYPVERARTLVSCDLALKGELRQYSGAYDFLQKTMNRDGIKGYYSGFSLYLFNYSLYLWIGYNLNETIHEIYKEVPAGRVLAGSLFMAKCLTYPFEVLRRRRQISDGVNYKVEPNVVHLQVGNILKTEGFKGFYRGFLPSSMLSLISLTTVVSVTEAFTQVSKE